MARAAYGDKLNKEIFPGIQGGPLMHVIAAKALAFKEALSSEFKEYQAHTVNNAKVLAQHLMENGIELVSGGTDNHMMLVDLTPMGITGKAAENALGQAGITVNKNAVPFDKLGPAVTSGFRIGTPALTTRGMRAEEMIKIAGLIVEVLRNIEHAHVIERVKGKTRELCEAFPIDSSNAAA